VNVALPSSLSVLVGAVFIFAAAWEVVGFFARMTQR
jgi:uncharacterized membrane protein